MYRLSLTTHNRKQRQTSLILTWWKVVLSTVAVLFLMMLKKHRDKRRLKHLSSNVQYSDDDLQESDDDLHDLEEVSSNTSVQTDETSPSVCSRKRKSRGDDEFNSAVSLMTDSLKRISKDISQGIEFDMKINELSEKIYPEILKMNSLSQREKFTAWSKVRSDPINVQTFWQLEEGDREAWVRFILEG